jgi:hypothetical protein
LPSRREAMQFCFSSLLGRQFAFTDALSVGVCTVACGRQKCFCLPLLDSA